MIQDDDNTVNSQNIDPDILKIPENIAQYIPGLLADQIMLKNKLRDKFQGFRITFRTLYYDNLFVFVLIPKDINLDAIEDEEEKEQKLLQIILTKILCKLFSKERIEGQIFDPSAIDTNELAYMVALHSFDRIKSITTISKLDILDIT